MTSTTTHAESNATAWSATILSLWDASQWAQDHRSTALGLHTETRQILEECGGDFDKRSGKITDDCEPWSVIESKIWERVQESVLSVQTRTAWHDPGEQNPEDTEFRIWLTLGGPSLQIRGELTSYGAAHEPELIYAEMGLAPTRLPLDRAHQSALYWFCLQFFG